MDAQRPAPEPESNRQKPPWHRRKGLLIWLSIIAVLVVIGVVNNLRGSDTEPPAPARERTTSRAAVATPFPARTYPPRYGPTATRPPLIRETRGIGVSRRALQSVFESPRWEFIFDPPDTLKNGRTRVLGQSADGLGLIELVGPADNLQKAYMTVAWPDLPEERIPSAAYLLTFGALAAPTWDGINLKTQRTSWVADNIENAMLLGEVSTTHQGLRFTLDFFAELRLLSLLIEPAR